MISQIQLQDDLFGLLASDPRLAKVNLVNERKFRLLAGALFSSIWMTPRGGSQGQGILVEMPKLLVDDPNVSGPKFVPMLSCVCVQAGDTAFAPGVGAQLYAEDMAQLVVDILHQLSDDGFGTFMAKGTVVEAANDPEFQGTNSLRVTLRCTPTPNFQTKRLPPCACVVSGGLATITCPATQALLYYTTDGTFPDNVGSNPGAMQYTAPFTVASGQVLRFVGYQAGYLNSPVGRMIVG